MILFRFCKDLLIDIYELNTLTNNVGPASLLATRCLQVISEDDESIDELMVLIAIIIRFHFYMYNLMTGFKTVEEAIVVCKAIIRVMAKYGWLRFM